MKKKVTALLAIISVSLTDLVVAKAETANNIKWVIKSEPEDSRYNFTENDLEDISNQAEQANSKTTLYRFVKTESRDFPSHTINTEPKDDLEQFLEADSKDSLDWFIEAELEDNIGQSVEAESKMDWSEEGDLIDFVDRVIEAKSTNTYDLKTKSGFTKKFYEIYKEHLSLKSTQLAPTPSINSAPPIGESDDSNSPLMEAVYQTNNGKKIKDSRIKFYGWLDVGGNISSAKNRYDVASGSGGNYPSGYYSNPNQLSLNQLVLNLERLPDTVQTKEISYGFRISTLYGRDYQYTIANRLMSNQLYKNHKEYGFDPVLVYGDIFIPYFAQGLNVRIGRYSSLQDVESMFSTANYTYGHSMLNTYDPYTHQGAIATLKLNKNWQTQFEIFNGSDTSITDTKNSRLSFGGCVRWESDSKHDSIYPCISGLNGGKYSYNNSQMHAATWYHKFNDKWSMATEAYYMWQNRVPNANNSTSASPILGTRAAQCNPNDLTCKSSVSAAAHYLVYQFKPKDFLTFRNDFFKDNHGQRTGYNTSYSSHTIGWTHWIGDVITLRPELRFDHSYNVKPYNSGTSSNQYIAAADMVVRF